MGKNDLISSAIWFCIGLFILLYSPQFDLGSLSLPGPGFMPFLMGVLVCIFSIVIFFQVPLAKLGKSEKIWANVQLQKLLFVLFILLLYTFLINIVGFLICTFFMISLLIHFVGAYRWFTCLLGAALTSVLSYLLFVNILGAILPRGILGF